MELVDNYTYLFCFLNRLGKTIFFFSKRQQFILLKKKKNELIIYLNC